MLLDKGECAMATILTFLSTAVFGLALLCFPDAGAQAARDGLSLCATVILPALFPYLVLSNLLVGQGLGDKLGRLLRPVMGRLFHVSGAGGTALALGLAGGYPTGAAVIRALLEQKAVTLEEAQSLLLFCNNAGPAFILSIAGAAVLGDMRLGFLLLGIHIISAVGVGILLRPKQQPRSSLKAPSASPHLRGSVLITSSVGKALTSSLNISAYIVLFSVLIVLLEQVIPALNLLPPSLHALSIGLLELSEGVCAVQNAAPLSLAVCAFLLGWGGCSVHCQTAALLEGSGLELAPYLRAKLLQGLLSAALALLCAPWVSHLPVAASAPVQSLMQLFPLSIPLGWLIWTVCTLALLGRERRSAC
jgi:sporulation integral membrane protein YlbJ